MPEKNRFGVIVEVGKEVDNVSVGDHVVLNNYKPCMECEPFRMGKNAIHCKSPARQGGRKANSYGYYGNYGWASYQIGKSKHAYKVDKNLPFEQVGFVEPFATKAYHHAFEAVALEGRLLIFAAGYPPPEWNVDPNPVHYKLWEVIGTFGCGPSEFQTAVDLLGKHAIDVSPLVEEGVPLKELQQAFEKASTPDNYRVAVMIQ